MAQGVFDVEVSIYLQDTCTYHGTFFWEDKKFPDYNESVQLLNSRRTKAMSKETAVQNRFSISLPESHQARLGEIAKQYRITQGEVIETLLEFADHAALALRYQAVREEKVAARRPKKDLLKQLNGLTSEQLERLLKQAQGVA